MNGQIRATIPALIGITPLLLAGIAGYVISSGEPQGNTIAQTQAVTQEQYQRMELAESLRADAKTAATELSDNVAADLAIDLTYTPTRLIAASDAEANERG